MLLDERWKAIPGWEDYYEASDLGRIKSARDGRNTWAGLILKSRISRAGYLLIGLRKPGIYKTFTVHRLIAATFLGPTPIGHQINHRDGDKTNNRLNNLEFMTPKQNIAHATLMGLREGRWGRAG